MNEDTLKGKWRQMKGKTKSKWAKLTDDDIDQIQGKTDNLIGKIQERYGIARDEAKQQVEEFKQSI